MSSPAVPRGTRFTAFERGGCQVDVLYQPCIDEVCRCSPATYRRDSLNALLVQQAVEDLAEIAAPQAYESDPWPRPERRLVPGDTLVTGDQKHPHVGDVEEPCSEIETAAIGHDDLGGMAYSGRATHVARPNPDATRRRTPPGECCPLQQGLHRPRPEKGLRRSDACRSRHRRTHLDQARQYCHPSSG